MAALKPNRGRPWWRRLLLTERAATASEYATIFAIVVIGVMVCVRVVGRHVTRAVRAADAKLARDGSDSFFGGPGGPGGAGASAKESGAPEGSGYVPKVQMRSEPGNSAAEQPQRGKSGTRAGEDVEGVRKLFGKPKGNKKQD